MFGCAAILEDGLSPIWNYSFAQRECRAAPAGLYKTSRLRKSPSANHWRHHCWRGRILLIWFLRLILLFLPIGLPVFFAFVIAQEILLFLNGQEKTLPILSQCLQRDAEFIAHGNPFLYVSRGIDELGRHNMRLVEFAQAVIGHLRGLAPVNTLSSMLFAGLSGSAVAYTWA